VEKARKSCAEIAENKGRSGGLGAAAREKMKNAAYASFSTTTLNCAVTP
jgi:hypothetical protein